MDTRINEAAPTLPSDKKPPPLAEGLIDKDEMQVARERIERQSKFNTTSARDILLHFQTLISAGYRKMLVEAPGLYFPDIALYVISKSGLARGHASLHEEINPLVPHDKRKCYGFVLYPESLMRTCLDKVLRKSAKRIVKELRISMENVFNRKHHGESLVDSDIERELIERMQNEISFKRKDGGS